MSNGSPKFNDKALVRRIIAELRPIDDEFMRVLFKDDIPLTQFVLRIITGKDDLIITEIETQRDLKKLAGGRSICLDAMGTDSEGKKYDLEIQRSDWGADPHRARYHLGALDTENLKAGQDFKELPDTYIIFITENDVFGKGEPLYIFTRTEAKTGEPLSDGTYIIYVNGQYRGDDAIGRLMHDFCCADPSEMYFEDMADRAKVFKDDERGETKMSAVVDRILSEMKDEWLNEGIAKGIAEGMTKGKMEGITEGRMQGITEGKKETARKMLAAGTFTTEQVAEYSGLSIEEVEKIKASQAN